MRADAAEAGEAASMAKHVEIADKFEILVAKWQATVAHRRRFISKSVSFGFLPLTSNPLCVGLLFPHRTTRVMLI